MKNKEFQRCGVVQVAAPPKPLVQWYDDLQADYKCFMEAFVPLLGLGQTNKNGTITSPEQTDFAARKQYGRHYAKVKQFVDCLTGGGEAASSSYAIFYTDFASSGRAKLTPYRRQFLAALRDGKDIEEFLARDVQLQQLDDWSGVAARLAAEPLEAVWDTVAPKLADPGRSLGITARAALPRLCRRPTNAVYCRALTCMIQSQLKSIKEKYALHCAAYEALVLEVGRALEHPLTKLLADLDKELEQVNYGLTKYVLKQIGRESSPAAKIVSRPKFRPLLAANVKELMWSYRQFKKYLALQVRKKYPAPSELKRDYKIPFGLTGLPAFDLRVEGGAFKVSFDKVGEITCRRSHYFNDLAVEKFKEKKRVAGYNISFNHQVKVRRGVGRVGQTFTGKVKELGLQRKDNGKFYLTLPYTLSYPADNFTAAKFFLSAEPDPKKYELPPSLRVMGLDLNLTNPICATVAEITAGRQAGSVHALDYGWGDIVVPPYHVAATGRDAKRLQALTRRCYRIRDVVRLYKAVRDGRAGLDRVPALDLGRITNYGGRKLMTAKTKAYLLKLAGVDTKEAHLRMVRVYIQNQMKLVRHKINGFSCAIRLGGYNNLGDTLRLLEAQDALRSVTESYVRIDLRPGDPPIEKECRFDTRRQNFRRHIARRLAAATTQYAVANRVNIVCLENLNMVQDRDSDKNGLVRLFSPRTLIACIVQALEKVGIATVDSVDPKGTSKTDPVTGDLGHRDTRKDKQSLFVRRAGAIVRIDSDLAASCNVLLRGLGHSVCPYKFHTERNNKKSENGFGESKRLGRFFKTMFAAKTPKFWLAPTGQVVVKKQKGSEPYGPGELYFRRGNLITRDQHLAEIEEIRTDVAEITGKPPLQDVCPDGGVVYENFSIAQVRDSA